MITTRLKRFSTNRAIACLLALVLWLLQSSTAVGQERQATLLEIKGPIGPAVSDFLEQGLEQSSALNVAVVIIRMDTPGGLDHSMRQIIQAILASPIPVITYVAPDGARAASAGTYILYASHIAAMAPATNLGAATPVRIGGLPSEPDTPDKEKEKQPPAPQGDTMERKMINDASAYIKALADRHGRNSDWAVKAVREAVSLSAKEAHAIGVIDIIATDLDDLLRQVNGRQVRMETGMQTIASSGLAIIPIEPTWRTRLLTVISDPNIAYLLMLLGIYGLIYELANPGFFLPGVVGGIALLLALYAFQVLPINYSGLALIILGILLLIAETFVPSFGSLGIGGIIAFGVGSLILLEEEELRISLTTIAGTTTVSAAFLLWLVGRLFAVRRKKVETGHEALIGMIGEVADDFEEEGRIWLLGESWQARYTGRLRKGEKVKVSARDGLCLQVTKIEEDI